MSNAINLSFVIFDIVNNLLIYDIVLELISTNSNIDFGLQVKPDIIINVQNQNNFKSGLGSYLKSKLMIIPCYKYVIKNKL